MRTPSPPYCRLDLAPPLADRFIVGVAPIDYGPVLLLMPFRFHLAMDTLPSRVLPTALRPARHYPRFRICRPSSGRQRDFNPPEQPAAQHTICPLLTSACGSDITPYNVLSQKVAIPTVSAGVVRPPLTHHR